MEQRGGGIARDLTVGVAGDMVRCCVGDLDVASRTVTTKALVAAVRGDACYASGGRHGCWRPPPTMTRGAAASRALSLLVGGVYRAGRP